MQASKAVKSRPGTGPAGLGDALGCTSARAESLRVLIVDAEAAFGASLCGFLRTHEESWIIDLVAGAEHATQAVQARPHDLVLIADDPERGISAVDFVGDLARCARS